MKPVSPVIPNKKHKEIVVAERQDEYQNLPSIPLEDGVILCRWHMTDEERKIVAETGDIYLLQWTGGAGVTPMLLQVEPPEITPPVEMMTAVRYSEQAIGNAKQYGFEIFEDFCSLCDEKVLFTRATLQTLSELSNMKIICTICFAGLKKENPDLQGVYLPNTKGEMERIRDVTNKGSDNENNV